MELLRCRRAVSCLVRALSEHRKLPRSPVTFQRQCRFNSTSLQTTPVIETAPPPGIQLRDYQEESIQSVLSHLKQGHRRLGISLATGAGKTVIFTQLIGRIPPRDEPANQTLIVVHRRELVEQAAHHCRLAYPDRTVEIEMGSSHASGTADITIASIRSLVSKDRILKLDPSRFKLVLVDEAHHIVAPSYREVLGHFGLNEPSTESPVLVGVSATFSRFDGLKLGAAIDQLVYHKDYVDLMNEKWLADAIFTTVKSEADLSKVRKDKFGDFAVGSLSKAVNTDKSNHITVRAWLANAQDRQSTLVFCVDVDHAKQLTSTFRQYGIDARYLTGTSSNDVRVEQLRAFRNREFPVLLNCALFTEGTDIPNIDCVLLARPTRSKNLLIQMIGRGLRLYPGKENCHIIDMVATLKTGVLSTPTLFGLHPDEMLKADRALDLKNRPSAIVENVSNSETDAPGSDDGDDGTKVTFTQYDSIYDLLEDMQPDRHIRSLSPNTWVRVAPDRYILSGHGGWLTLEKEEAGMFVVRYVLQFKDENGSMVSTRPRTVATAADLEAAVRGADTFASTKFNEHYIASWQPWRKAPATQAQLKLLNRARIRDTPIRPQDLTRGQAADMITKFRHGGGRKQFVEMLAKKRAEQRERAQREELEQLQQRGDVKVGPLEA